MKIPVLIIGYARPEGVLRILESLKSYDANIYVFIDGDKKKETRPKKHEFENIISNYISNHSNKNLRYQFRSENVGAAVNVINSIDSCFENEEHLIILEDDLIIGSDFLDFIELSIPVMEANKNIKMITGTNPFPNKSTRNTFEWTSYPIVWGWAISKSNWIEMRHAIFEKTISNKNFVNRKTFNFFRAGKNQCLNGRVDAWDLPLAGSFHSYSWRCLIPPVNLVSNIGFDEGATHTTENMWPLGMEIEVFSREDFEQIDTTGNFEFCQDAKMENMIFKIKKRHIFSYMKSRVLQALTTSKTTPLKNRVTLVSNKNSLG